MTRQNKPKPSSSKSGRPSTGASSAKKSAPGSSARGPSRPGAKPAAAKSSSAGKPSANAAKAKPAAGGVARPKPASRPKANIADFPAPKNAAEVLERARLLAAMENNDEDWDDEFPEDDEEIDLNWRRDADDDGEDAFRYEDEYVDLSGDAEEREIYGAVDLDEEARIPLIAIVGRPNVGKSRLYNRLTKSRFAIVEDMPGVTRDRQYGDGEWADHVFQVVDTGGFEPDSQDELLRQMREQAELAIHEADIVFFVTDARAGVTPADREIANLLRKVERPIYLLANKVDNEEQSLWTSEFYELGFPEVYPISAEHGSGLWDVMDEVIPHLPLKVEREETDRQVSVAIVGRPNAGKSTFVNKLLGENRLLTSDVAGTTRDAINTLLKTNYRDYLFIDTAGIRRKKRIHELIEKYSVVQAFKALDRADIAIIMLDATQPFSSQDQRIAGLAHDKGCGIIFVLNKWDLVKKDHRTADEYVKKVREAFRFAPYAPVVTISALTGQRVHKMLDLIDDVFEQYTRRVSTSEANAFLEAALRRRQPPQSSSRSMRFYFCSQVATRPPTFMFAVNNPGLLHFSYERYLVNVMRQTFGFKGVPIKVFYRGKNAT